MAISQNEKLDRGALVRSLGSCNRERTLGTKSTRAFEKCTTQFQFLREKASPNNALAKAERLESRTLIKRSGSIEIIVPYTFATI